MNFFFQDKKNDNNTEDPQISAPTTTHSPSQNENTNFASPSILIPKLQELMTLTDSLWEEASLNNQNVPTYKMHYSFANIVRMMESIKLNHSDYRDNCYSNNNNNNNNNLTKAEIEQISQALQYSDLAYESSHSKLRLQIKEMGLSLLRHDIDTEPGRIGHFIAMNHEKKLAVFGLKGTSHFSDVLTDLVFKPYAHTLDSPFMDNGDSSRKVEIRCHEGILQAAKMMLEETQDVIEYLFLPAGYKILLCGHSLGAGTACLLGLLLRSKIPALRKDDLLRVIAIATPAVLNYEASRACAGFTTSVVNNSDVVPRMSLPNVKIMARLMFKVLDKIEETDKVPKSLGDLKKFITNEGEMILTTDELDEFYEGVYEGEDVYAEDGLYVPGRVVMLWEKGRGRQPVAGDEKEDGDCEVGAVITEGGTKMLRQIEMTRTLLHDHLATSYRKNIDDLLKEY